MEKIRLGFVRADTHSFYYGIMLQECDPLLLQKTDYAFITMPATFTIPRF